MKSWPALAMSLGGLAAMLATPTPAATCNVSTTGVALGTYVPNQRTSADSVGAAIVTCTKGILDALPMTINYAVDLSKGGGTSYALRAMASRQYTLRYNLYRDVSRVSIWGDATDGTSSVTGSLILQPSPGSASVSHTIYGRIFAGQNAMPGTYGDTIFVTVSY